MPPAAAVRWALVVLGLSHTASVRAGFAGHAGRALQQARNDSAPVVIETQAAFDPGQPGARLRVCAFHAPPLVQCPASPHASGGALFPCNLRVHASLSLSLFLSLSLSFSLSLSLSLSQRARTRLGSPPRPAACPSLRRRRVRRGQVAERRPACWRGVGKGLRCQFGCGKSRRHVGIMRPCLVGAGDGGFDARPCVFSAYIFWYARCELSVLHCPAVQWRVPNRASLLEFQAEFKR